ncbi:phage distal tail protein, Rcc01695 family [Neorhizobium sp. NPDC001467]|uniref:phage distal tail protein, Rcc01695 family n=1 Tax=Neorhizobium sp. NPDC001467 TaxID=3390595 RepID=UPI003CFC306E
MSGFHDVRFPLRVALGVSGGPVRRTEIVNLSNGREQRNGRWRHSRRSYDAGSGIRSISDLYEVLAFFEARGGQLYGFRFRDPLDWKSCGPLQAVSADDQVIGVGDGQRRVFQLAKTYADAGGGFERAIAKPVAGSLLLAVDGDPVAQGWALDPGTGAVTFAAEAVPAPGAVVTAGYEFDVPVRFDIDRIDVNLSGFDAGRIPTIPLTEILP